MAAESTTTLVQFIITDTACAFEIHSHGQGSSLLL